MASELPEQYWSQGVVNGILFLFLVLSVSHIIVLATIYRDFNHLFNFLGFFYLIIYFVLLLLLNEE